MVSVDVFGLARTDEDQAPERTLRAQEPRLASTFAALQNQIQLVRLRAIVLPGRPQQSHAEHRALVAALRRDPESARPLLRSHIRSVKEDVLRAARA